MTTNDNKWIDNKFSTWSHSPVSTQSGPCDIKVNTCCEMKLQWHKTIILVATESLACEYLSSDTTQEMGSLNKPNLSRKP